MVDSGLPFTHEKKMAFGTDYTEGGKRNERSGQAFIDGVKDGLESPCDMDLSENAV